MATPEGTELWIPDPERADTNELARFRRWVTEQEHVRLGGEDYAALWNWSVSDIGGFWTSLANFYGITLATTEDGSVAPSIMPSNGWFPGSTINYAGQIFATARTGDAVVSVGDNGSVQRVSWSDLERQVAAVSVALRRFGVSHGDRVVGVLPVGIEAVVSQLAAAAVGAIWSVVSPEFGEQAISSRLRQLAPRVLIAVNSYSYGGRTHDRTDIMAAVVAELTTVQDLIWVGTPPDHTTSAVSVHTWAEIVTGEHRLVVDELPFEHPLWVLFSSGTTGVPKGIVHGHGGVVLEHSKVLGLHADVDDTSVLLIVGSTSWVVWTMQVSGLLRGATIVLLEGNPAAPELDRVWNVAAEHAVTVLGVGAAYIHACNRSGLEPSATYDLSALKMLQVTGSPLSVEGYEWVYRCVDSDVWLASMSGGTDIASIFVGGVSSAPVRAGRIQGPALGVAAAAWAEDRTPLIGTRGELVITEPMPSMPLRFWGDPDGSRYRRAYFAMWPGVWRQGDYAEFDSDGSCAILGRSDSTLNRNGIRMGSADIYRAVENVTAVTESLVVGVEEGEGYYMPLYVVLADGTDFETACSDITTSIRSALSPRHLPDEIIAVRAVPHTRTGKKLEVPIKRLLQGETLDEVVDLGSVDDANLLKEFAELAERHRRALAVPAHLTTP